MAAVVLEQVLDALLPQFLWYFTAVDALLLHIDYVSLYVITASHLIHQYHNKVLQLILFILTYIALSHLLAYCLHSVVKLFTHVDRDLVDYYTARGLRVVVWTPNSVHDKAYVARTLGCSYITDTVSTDHSILLSAPRRKY